LSPEGDSALVFDLEAQDNEILELVMPANTAGLTPGAVQHGVARTERPVERR